MNRPAFEAKDRLEASRRHLQRALRTNGCRPAGTASGTESREAETARLTAQALRSWWSLHPLRIGSEATIAVANALLRPAAERHPFGLVAGAVLAGGLLVWIRPWRWMVRPGLVTGLCQQLVHEAVVKAWPQWLASRRSKKT